MYCNTDEPQGNHVTCERPALKDKYCMPSLMFEAHSQDQGTENAVKG